MIDGMIDDRRVSVSVCKKVKNYQTVVPYGIPIVCRVVAQLIMVFSPNIYVKLDSVSFRDIKIYG